MEHEERGEPLATTLPSPAAGSPSPFTCQEWVALLLLRHRYREGQDFWDAHELAHLRFLRWLYQAGRIES